jgi:hypothetical protein
MKGKIKDWILLLLLVNPATFISISYLEPIYATDYLIYNYIPIHKHKTLIDTKQ